MRSCSWSWLLTAQSIGDASPTTNTDVEGWWASRNGDVTIKTWYEVAIKVMLLQPSSAAAERVFSMLKALYRRPAGQSDLEGIPTSRPHGPLKPTHARRT